MADIGIRNEFVEGVHEVFSTLFNNGSEKTDGVFFYALSEENTTDVYGESKYKIYEEPVLLVCKATLYPTHGEQDVEEVKDQATFTVTYKSMIDNGLDVSQQGLSKLRRGMVSFHNVFYKVDLISPKAYVEDVFLLYDFQCTEDPETTTDSFMIATPPEEPEVPPEEGDQNEPVITDAR